MRWIDLEIAATEHGPPVCSLADVLAERAATPPHEGDVMTEKPCKKCGRPTTSAEGVCGNRSSAECARIASEREAALADDAVLDRTSVKPPPPAKRAKKPEPTGESEDLKNFFQLAEALGLEPQEMLDGWCRDWVEKTRARALAVSTDVDELANAIKLVEAATAAPKSEAPTGD